MGGGRRREGGRGREKVAWVEVLSGGGGDREEGGGLFLFPFWGVWRAEGVGGGGEGGTGTGA